MYKSINQQWSSKPSHPLITQKLNRRCFPPTTDYQIISKSYEKVDIPPIFWSQMTYSFYLFFQFYFNKINKTLSIRLSQLRQTYRTCFPLFLLTVSRFISLQLHEPWWWWRWRTFLEDRLFQLRFEIKIMVF